jgi:hypothetical protein
MSDLSIEDWYSREKAQKAQNKKLYIICDVKFDKMRIEKIIDYGHQDNDFVPKNIVLNPVKGQSINKDRPLTLTGGNCLKRGNLLLYPDRLAFRTPDFFLFIFRNCHHQGKALFTFFTFILICRHGPPPVSTKDSATQS